MAVSDWNVSASLNTTLGGINIAPGMARSDVDNAIRMLMSEAKAGFTEPTNLASTASGKGAALVGFKQSQTGAADRELSERGRDWVSALDFILTAADRAAVIAGTLTSSANLTSQLQDALDTGKDVFFPKGTYWVDGTPANALSPSSGQTIYFEAGAILKVIPNGLDTYYAIDLTGLSNVTIEGHGEIVGERGSHTGPSTDEHGFGIACLNATNIVVRDLRFRDFYGDGIYVGGTGVSGQSVNVLIDNVTSDNNYRNALSITSVNGCWVRGGKFTGSTGLTGAMVGIDVEPNSGKPNVENVLLDGVICTGNGGPGISVSQPTALDITVRNAICESNTKAGLSSGFAGPGFRIEGGSFSSNTEQGIYIFGQAANAAAGVSIQGADVHSNTLDGIKIDGNLFRFAILGNRVSLNGAHGIHVVRTTGSYADDGLIEGNHVWNNSQTTNITYDNIMLGTGCHYVTVKGNWIRRNAITSIIASVTTTPTNQPRYGINASENESNFIIDNDVYTGGNTANILIGGANVTVKGNIGFKTENRVLSSGFNVETSGTKTVTIAHGCAYTPLTHHCQFSEVGTSGYTFTITNKQIRSVDATNVTIDVTVGTGTGVAGQTANLSLSVERPSVL